MMCAVALTIGESAIYLIVVLLCCRDTAALARCVPASHVGRHGKDMTVEELLTEQFIGAWLKGEEQWLRYAWVEEWSEKVNWNLA